MLKQVFLKKKKSLMHCNGERREVSLSLAALNPDADFSSLEIEHEKVFSVHIGCLQQRSTCVQVMFLFYELMVLASDTSDCIWIMQRI